MRWQRRARPYAAALVTALFAAALTRTVAATSRTSQFRVRRLGRHCPSVFSRLPRTRPRRRGACEKSLQIQNWLPTA